MKKPTLRAGFHSTAVFAAFAAVVLGSTGCTSVAPSKDLFEFKPVRKSIWSAKGMAETPVILDDTLYYLSGYPWNNQVYLHAIDRNTGKEKWSSDDELGQFVVDGDKIFATGRTNLFRSEPAHTGKCFVRAYSTKDCSTIWDLPSITDRRGAKIVGHDKYLYVLANSQVTVVNKDTGEVVSRCEESVWPSVVPNVVADSGFYYAELVNRKIGKFLGSTGKLVGELELGPIDDKLPRVLIIKDGMLVVAGGDGKASIINLQTNGREKVDTGWLTSKLIMADKTAFFAAQTVPLEEPLHKTAVVAKTPEQIEKLRKLEAATPKVKLREELKKTESKTPATSSKQKTDSSNPGSKTESSSSTKQDSDEQTSKKNDNESEKDKRGFFLVAFDLLTAKYKWKTPAKTPIRSGPLLVNGIVYAGAEIEEDKSLLYAIKATDGSVHWQAECLAPLSDVAHGSGMIFVNGGGTLFAIDASTGERVWAHKIKDAGIVGDPVFQDGIVYVVGDDSNLYALKADRRKPK